MENPTAFQIQYRDHQRQMAWVNTEVWQFSPPKTVKQDREVVTHRAAESAAHPRIPRRRGEMTIASPMVATKCALRVTRNDPPDSDPV